MYEVAKRTVLRILRMSTEAANGLAKAPGMRQHYTLVSFGLWWHHGFPHCFHDFRIKQ